MHGTPATKESPIAKVTAEISANGPAERVRTPGPAVPLPVPAVASESADSVLAKNLVVARVVAGVTQQALADAAGVSRATVAQLETGYSDPRLSTIVELATALGIPPILLLLGKPEALALSAFFEKPSSDLSVNAGDVARMRRLVETGMLKDRLRAALVGASAARDSGEEGSIAAVSAAIFSAIHPGPGTVAGMLLGRLLSAPQSS
jgi:transcriptional regulator with XRE-family HTH domain